MRTVNLNFENKLQLEADWPEIFKAIGYLSTWGMDYPRVEIYQDGKSDLIATYFDNKGERRYTIGAIWHDGHYGFHS